MVKLGGSGSFTVSGGIVGLLGFRDGVSASYSNFRRVGNFDISHTAAVWLSLAKKSKLNWKCHPKTKHHVHRKTGCKDFRYHFQLTMTYSHTISLGHINNGTTLAVYCHKQHHPART